MSEDLDFPKFEYQGSTPEEFNQLASEIVSEAHTHSFGSQPVSIDPMLIIGLAQLLFSIFKYCKQGKIQNSLERVRRHPDGIYARRLADRLRRSMPEDWPDRTSMAYKTVQVCAAKSKNASYVRSLPEA